MSKKIRIRVYSMSSKLV